MNKVGYFTLVLSQARRKASFFRLIKAVSKDEKPPEEDDEKPTKKKDSSDDKNGPGSPEKPPRSLYEVVAAAGEEGFAFDEIVRMYAQAAGLKPRKVNRTSIRYSLDKMTESGKIKTFNRDGEIRYVASGG